MKLYAISDLHVGHRENLAALSELPACPGDWLILAGDVGDTIADLDAALDVLQTKFERLLWVPGNHELWALPTGTALRGERRYEALVEACRRRGVLTPEDPYVTWRGDGGEHLLCPLFLLYDYSFRPDDVPVDRAVRWARDAGILCTDEKVLAPDPYPDLPSWCRARCAYSAERLDRAMAESDAPTVLINHFPLKQELAVLPRVPRFMVWCGTRATEDWHRRYRADVVVSGHLHIPSTRIVDGVRFEEVSLGYPRERKYRESLRGWGVADHLRQILPAPGLDTSSRQGIRS